MSEIWVATSGSYSDYRVHAAFATKEVAQAFCDRENVAVERRSYDEYQVETLPYYEELPEVWAAHHAFGWLEEDGALTLAGGTAFRQVGPIDTVQAYDVRQGRIHLRVNNYRSEDEARQALCALAARINAERVSAPSANGRRQEPHNRSDANALSNPYAARHGWSLFELGRPWGRPRSG